MDVKIIDSWKKILQSEFDAPYFEKIAHFLKIEKSSKTIYPPGSNIFKAFDLTPPESLKVVILGQDPYHGPGQAHGLCFSVPEGIAIPPSLQNIYKELHTDTGFSPPAHGNLTNWASQGVFLLNASLTVENNKPMSHSKIGWEIFTNQVIKHISMLRPNIVFLLWGKFAGEKAAIIADNQHLVLKAAHPSPLSAHNGFFGCNHFSKTNDFLQSKGINLINWQL